MRDFIFKPDDVKIASDGKTIYRIPIYDESGNPAGYQWRGQPEAQNPDEATPYDTASVLQDSTAALYGLGSDAVVDEVLSRIGGGAAVLVSSGVYEGDGSGSRIIETPFWPDVVFVWRTLFATIPAFGMASRGANLFYSGGYKILSVIEKGFEVYLTSESDTNTNGSDYNYLAIKSMDKSKMVFVRGSVRNHLNEPLHGVEIYGVAGEGGSTVVSDSDGYFSGWSELGAIVRGFSPYVDAASTETTVYGDGFISLVVSPKSPGYVALLTSQEISVSGLFGPYKFAAVNGGESGYSSSTTGFQAYSRGGHGGQCLVATKALSSASKITAVVGAGGATSSTPYGDNGGATSISIDGAQVLQTDPTASNGARRGQDEGSGAGYAGDTVLSWADGIRPGGGGAYKQTTSGTYSGGADFGGALSGSAELPGEQPGGGGSGSLQSGHAAGGPGAVYVGWEM